VSDLDSACAGLVVSLIVVVSLLYAMLEFVTKVYLPADILYYKCNIVELLIVKLNLFSSLNTIVKFKNIWLHCEMIVV